MINQRQVKRLVFFCYIKKLINDTSMDNWNSYLNLAPAPSPSGQITFGEKSQKADFSHRRTFACRG